MMDKKILHLENNYPTQTPGRIHIVALWVVQFDDGTMGIKLERHAPDDDDLITFALTQDQCRQIANALMGEV